MNTHEEHFPLHQVLVLNWILLGASTLAAWLFYSSESAQALLIGGLIANCSFIALKRHLTKIFNQGNQAAIKFQFFVKYYARLSLLAVFLYFLVRVWHIHIFGLLAGLSTVVLSIVIVGIGQAKKLYFSMKEAA